MSIKGKTITSKTKSLTEWKDRIAPEDYDELKNTFQIFDQDNSGTIDPVQINKVLQELGLDQRNSLVTQMILGLKEQDKPLNFNEFLGIICSKVGQTRTKDGLRRVFSLWDTDESGLVSFEHFKSVARSIGQTMNDDDILELMHSTFINKQTSSNEGFTFDEFYLIVSKFTEGR